MEFELPFVHLCIIYLAKNIVRHALFLVSNIQRLYLRVRGKEGIKGIYKASVVFR